MLGQFEDDEVECITRAIADLKNIPRQIQDEVIAEFERDLKTGRLQGVRGGHDIASDLLQSALGPESAAQMMQRLGGAPLVPGFKLSTRQIRRRSRRISGVSIRRRSH